MDKTAWLELINLEVKSIETKIEPKGKRDLDDEILGEISEYSKKLYTLWMRTEKESSQLELDIKYDSLEEEVNITLEKLAKLKSTSRLLKELFWYTCNDEFDTWTCNVGIREGWILVKVKDSPLDFIGNIFKGFNLD